jgi:hypothetical protein
MLVNDVAKLSVLIGLAPPFYELQRRPAWAVEVIVEERKRQRFD